MSLFTEQYNDWGDRRVKWDNILTLLLVIGVVVALLK